MFSVRCLVSRGTSSYGGLALRKINTENVFFAPGDDFRSLPRGSARLVIEFRFRFQRSGRCKSEVRTQCTYPSRQQDHVPRTSTWKGKKHFVLSVTFVFRASPCKSGLLSVPSTRAACRRGGADGVPKFVGPIISGWGLGLGGLQDPGWQGTAGHMWAKTRLPELEICGSTKPPGNFGLAALICAPSETKERRVKGPRWALPGSERREYRGVRAPRRRCRCDPSTCVLT